MIFKLKLLVTFIVYGLSLVLISQLFIFNHYEESIKSASIEKASEVFSKKDELFRFYIKDIELKLMAIEKSSEFKEYLSTKKNLSSLESLFLCISRTSQNMMQLRYIDENGDEKIRVDRDAYASNVMLAQNANLQNKKRRYYFEKVNQLKPNVLWYSKIDLNREHDVVEIPFKPVLRVAIAVENRGEKKGILIINIFMKNFLIDLVHNPFNNIYLFNKSGNLLINSKHKTYWNQYIKNGKTLSTHFTQEKLNVIFKENSYKDDNIYAQKMFLKNDENLYMIVEPKNEIVQGEISSILYELILIFAGVILVSFPMSYFFSVVPARLKKNVDKQKEEQDVLLSLFDLGNAVLFKWNNDDVWSVHSVSKSVESLLNYTQSDFINAKVSYSDCIHSDDIKYVFEELDKAIADKVYFVEHKPYRVITKDKELKWILDRTVIVRDKRGEVINFIGYLSDITELKNTEILLQKLSRTDQLTQIYNRMYLDDLLQKQYYRFNRSAEECSIILVDIDYFKLVNDVHGHLVGDKVLIEFALLLKESLRDGDSIGRWGGEEFLIVLPYTSLSDAMDLAEKLRGIVERKCFTVINHKTASFGVASFVDGLTVELLTNEADIALYHSKNAGRNRVSTIQNYTSDA